MYNQSKYLPIWERLKEQGEVIIVVPLPLHARVRKAVIKRKDEDLGYKLTCSHSYITTKLSIKTVGNTIKFKLTKYQSLNFSLKDL